MTSTLPCWIYKSPLKDEMYLYLAEEAGFDSVPKPLMSRFGTPMLVMELDLHEGRRLAREDVVAVMRNLTEQKYHLQIPLVLEPSLYHNNKT